MAMPHNDGQHIADILNRTECPKHRADKGTPCWVIRYSFRRGYSSALCGLRIRRAGFVGVISSTSVQTKSAHDKKRASVGRPRSDRS